jgi:1,2-diacylglycerol 3-alpha-glucosyltransferase
MFTDTYLPSRDGVVTSILLTKIELERLGHQVYVFAPEPGKGEVKEPGVFYFRSVGFRRYAGYRIPIFPTNKCEILKELQVDVIHTHGLLFMALRSMFAGRTLKKPVVVTFHTMVTEAAKFYNFTPFPDQMVQRLMWIYLKRVLQRSEVVIAPTEAIKKELIVSAPRMRRIEVIPTGVDSTRFHPGMDGTKVRMKYGIMDKKVILHVGRIAWEKNLDLVLKGFEMLAKRNRDVRLMIVGSGPAKEHYERMAEELGIKDLVTFTGFLPDEQLPEHYAACDVLTIASKFETQGLVGLEAMAMGKPVVGINFRAVAELIDDGINGYRFEEDPESWMKAIEMALATAKEMGAKAIERASRFSLADGTRQLVELYGFAIKAKAVRVGRKD